MLPVKDLNRSSTTPHVTHFLLIANITVFAVYFLSSQNIILSERFASIIGQEFVLQPSEIVLQQKLYTLLTSMFMHANWLHLFGNMLFLYVFGDNVEDAFGHLSYLALYLTCGSVAAFAHILSVLGTAEMSSGVVGASGAISGVLGSYAVLFPRARVLTAVGYIIVPLPAILFLGFWFVMQWLSVYFDLSGGVAYWAHIGGFAAGVFLALVIGRSRKKAQDKRLRL